MTMDHTLDNNAAPLRVAAQDDRDALERHADPEAEVDDGPGWRDGRIANLAGLEDAGRKVVEAEEQVALNEAAFRAEIAPWEARIAAAEERLLKANAPFLRRAERYRGFMLGFMDLERAQVLKGLPAKTKSRRLVCGLVVKYRSHAGGYRWDTSKTPAENKAALLAWAQEQERLNPALELVTDQPVVQLDEVKSWLTTLRSDPKLTVETPPGLEYVPPGETLTVGVETKEEP